ncbi:unnamed protein product, partial [Leptidea sinapis]
MEKRVTRIRVDPMPSILKKPQPQPSDLLDKSNKLKRERARKNDVSVKLPQGSGVTPAARAACADRVLMAAPQLAGARDADGLTPLHLAVVHGNVPLVQTLLAAGADVNAKDDEHHTVVHWAT